MTDIVKVSPGWLNLEDDQYFPNLHKVQTILCCCSFVPYKTYLKHAPNLYMNCVWGHVILFSFSYLLRLPVYQESKRSFGMFVFKRSGFNKFSYFSHQQQIGSNWLIVNTLIIFDHIEYN